MRALIRLLIAAAMSTVAAAPHPRPAPSVPRNATEACITARENGGSYSRSSNPNHFGRYQFSRSSWARHGGVPAHWGTASPAEQDRVFMQAVADDQSYREWTPFDGC